MFEDIISLNNLFAAWEEFIKGKRFKKDVANFTFDLSSNLYRLHIDLKNKTYEHGVYHAFGISDPKPRRIYKAIVRDRVLHHAIYRVLYPYFDKKFIHDIYSCRDGKGTHRAIKRFDQFARKVSKNNTQTCWVLKCDIKKFFATMDHSALLGVLKGYIFDSDTLWLLKMVIYTVCR